MAYTAYSHVMFVAVTREQILPLSLCKIAGSTADIVRGSSIRNDGLGCIIALGEQ